MNTTINMTQEQKINYNIRANCEQCGTTFDDIRYRVRHHNHQTGHYISALCSRCNTLLRNVREIPIYCHNLSGFDGNIIISSLGGAGITDNVNKNSEKLLTFTFNSFKFIDSLMFMRESLATLTNDLFLKGSGNFTVLRGSELCQTGGQFDKQKFDLMLSKLPFPYAYLTGHDILLEKSLPPISAFKNDMTSECISVAEYDRAKKVYALYKCQNFGEFLEIYVRLDTILLAGRY